MTEQQDIPQPTDTGTEGTQTAPAPGENRGLVRTPGDGGINAYPVSNAIVELADSHPRGFTSVTTVQLMAAYTQHVTIENAQLRNEVKTGIDESRKLSDSLHDEQRKAAILRERLLNEVRNRPLRNISITLGSALALWAIELFTGSQLKYGMGALVFGALLLGMGWLTAPSHKELP